MPASGPMAWDELLASMMRPKILPVRIVLSKWNVAIPAALSAGRLTHSLQGARPLWIGAGTLPKANAQGSKPPDHITNPTRFCSMCECVRVPAMHLLMQRAHMLTMHLILQHAHVLRLPRTPGVELLIRALQAL